MSHFTVLVIGDDPEKQLAPFDESIEVQEYKDGDGELTNCNPKSKWDWYELGGRWTGRLKLKNNSKGIKGTPGLMTDIAKDGFADQAFLKDIEKESILPTFAIVKDGVWYEKGSMGWFACVSDEKDNEVWEKEFNDIINKLTGETLISMYDCHKNTHL